VPLNLTKVAVGCRTLEALEKRVAARTRGGEVRVVTRMRPKRMDELVGGSLHWIVRHRIVARQQILRFEDRPDGRIDIICSGELVMLPPIPRRAHQGWRYFEGEVPEEGDGSGLSDLPPRMYAKLAGLGLV
jgi:hypothetical protein